MSTGCSTGGQEGLIEAQYYPDDYDGILIGAPVVNRTWGHALAVWDWQAANASPGHKLNDAKLILLDKAVIADCGARQRPRGRPSVVADPSVCRFDPASLLCRGRDTDACLTPGEVETVRAFYSGPLNGAGKRTYYGWMPGSEAPGQFGWNLLQSPPNDEPAFDGLFKWVFGAKWDWKAFNFDRDMPRVDAELGPDLNGAVRGDMRAFAARGGKLVIYQGWADTLVAPMQTIDAYKRATGQAKGRGFARLFLAPGVQHCGGGAGPTGFNSANGGTAGVSSSTARDDLFVALSRWVEDGEVPERVIATRSANGAAEMRRPLCAYPMKAWYRGSGDTGDARNFVCSVAKPAAKPSAGRV